MKSLINIVFCALLVLGCSTSNKSEREVASNEEAHEKATGQTYIGVAKYGYGKIVRKRYKERGSVVWKKKKVPSTSKSKFRAVRAYIDELPNQKNHYNVVLLEYVNLFEMAPKYIFSNKSDWISRKIGYLNQIAKRITVYRATPTAEKGKYELQHLKVVNGQLEPASKSEPSFLQLSSDRKSDNLLDGAKISKGTHGEPVDIEFPNSEEKESYGLQYALANFVYRIVPLDSTWRSEFLPGPYLASYGDKEDVVLNLEKGDDSDSADFVINSKRSHLSKRKREKQFTNKVSAYLEGKYTVTKPQKGLFVFTPTQGTDGKHVEEKIGLFIDIFDASKSLNQDVVELVLVDPEKPEDFLMYYEHPDNGEGE